MPVGDVEEVVDLREGEGNLAAGNVQGGIIGLRDSVGGRSGRIDGVGPVRGRLNGGV